ncbi:MAG: TauD/TfdA family dioxygenase [Alphaproteobacteria bacterium]
MTEIRRLNENIGAEAIGYDLGKPLSPEEIGALNQALLDNLVLVIRGQELDAVQYRDAMAQFGEPMLQHREAFRLPECPDVSRVVNREKMRPAAMWHTDHTNHERPPKATILYARKLPSKGGDTCFASMYKGYESLPEEDRRKLEGMVTINSLEKDNPTYSATDRDKYEGGVSHPLIRTHPETGRKAVYFHLTKAQGIAGMPDEAVRPFLEGLLDKVVQPEWVYRHHWKMGDVVICDNRCALHRADPNYDQAEERLLWRVILRGDRPH